MVPGDPRRKRSGRGRRSPDSAVRRSRSVSEGGTAEATEEQAVPPPPVPVQDIETADTCEAVQDEVTELRDRLLRVTAEFENYRKRQARDFNRLINQGRKELIEELLVVLDNFDRAEEHKNGKHSAREIEEGLVQTCRMLKTILEREGLAEIRTSEMDPFDPNIHEAMIAEDRDNLMHDSVLQVLQKGYTLGNELLRPVRVMVGKAVHEEGEDQ